MVAIAAERTIRVVEEACRGGVNCLRIIGGEYATQLMGPIAWDELIGPFDRPLGEMIHSHGSIGHYHIMARCSAFWPASPIWGSTHWTRWNSPLRRHRDAPGRGSRRPPRLSGGGTRRHGGARDPLARGGAARGCRLLEREDTSGPMLGGTSSRISGQAAARNFRSGRRGRALRPCLKARWVESQLLHATKVVQVVV